ncbi:MAG: hypothetical protein LPK01_07330 [Hymenobacteraceae bacterium]|nr:hypothetical protein [Hymenobacteraceae bacterium]
MPALELMIKLERLIDIAAFYEDYITMYRSIVVISKAFFNPFSEKWFKNPI